ncbi:16S rRNA (guanine(966)-N(2))-methyltransferase RsmD [Microbacterium sediminicola]|uniref:16S rRNA (Guanine(966)-N(2))-methyltransferase RsmD n=1 Tax=Microbacterium sediminicola TaxID=415210 RepID=A0ABP4TNM4_9MICO
MTRIIAGAAGSLPLEVPGSGTRPTSDRVRESLFGSLETRGLDDLAVLDLYAGSGALGIEAVSRGAASADLVEKAPRAVAVIERNIRRVERAIGPGRLRPHRAAADAFLASTRTSFDLVFLDPPYDLAETELADTLTLVAERLAPEGIVIVERATRSGVPVLPSGLVLERERRYGDTTLWWLLSAE